MKIPFLVSIFASSVSVLAVMVSLSAEAQEGPVCKDRDKMVNFLAKRHNEYPSSIGLTASGQLLEIISNDNGSFTVILTSPNNKSCMVAAGKAWHVLSAAEKAKLSLMAKPES